jgi:cytochrome c-type biogenesis protein CcmH/NrfG
MRPTIEVRTPFFLLTIVMAVVIGFLAGYIYTNQVNWNAQRATGVAGTDAPPTSGLPPASPDSVNGPLPEGHPPINPDPMIAAMKAEVEKDPSNLEKAVRLANFLYDNKRYADAIGWYLKALKLDPKNPNIETDLGTAYYYTGDSDSALRHFENSLRLDPRHVQTIHNKFIVLLEGKKDIPGARAALKQLESVDSENSVLPGLRDMLQKAEKGN